MAQQLQAALVGPLQVVEDEDQRSVQAHPAEQVDDRREQPVALGVGVDRRRWAETAQPTPDLGEHRAQLGRLVAHQVRQLVVGEVPYVVPDRLDQRAGTGW